MREIAGAFAEVMRTKSVERGQRNLSLHNILKIAAGLGVAPAERISGLEPLPGADVPPTP